MTHPVSEIGLKTDTRVQQTSRFHGRDLLLGHIGHREQSARQCKLHVEKLANIIDGYSTPLIGWVSVKPTC